MSLEGEERRLRRVRMSGSTSYYYSLFRINDDGSKVMVSEKRIDRSIYESLLEFRDKKISNGKELCVFTVVLR